MRQKVITKWGRLFITKYDSFLTKCEDFITKRNNYDKMQRLLQNESLHTFMATVELTIRILWFLNNAKHMGS